MPKEKTRRPQSPHPPVDGEIPTHKYFPPDTVVNDDGRIIQVRDVWLALKRATGALALTAALTIVPIIFAPQEGSATQKVGYYAVAALIFLFMGRYTWKVWDSYNQGILVSSKHNQINFPASDVENTLMDIITLKRMRDYANRLVYSLSDIDKVWVDRQRRKVTHTVNGKKKTKTVIVYTVNLAGSFGSKNIEFTSRQKRDETRSAISICAKDLGLKISVGANVDMQG